jgi:hypothetical protein
MSSTPIPPTTSPVPQLLSRRDLKIHMHSPLIYWWPVWAVGLVMAAWTYFDNRHMVLVPQHAVVAGNQVTAPAGDSIHATMVHVARSPIPGAIFATTVLAVVILSHVWLRGVWALFAVACLTTLVFLLSWMEWWDELFRGLRAIQVYLNLGAYLVLSVSLFLAWVAAVFVFDRRTYLAFSVGQIRFRDELGSEEKSFDTGGVVFEKKPYDWFRWLVGFGAGDMVIRIGGPHPQVIEMPNVVRVGKSLNELEQRLRTRDVE